MYGKLIDGVLINAPLRLSVNGRVYYNPTNEKYEQAGYKKIVETPYPELAEGEEKYYVSSYQEQNGKIVKVWAETAPPVEEMPEDNVTMQDDTDAMLIDHEYRLTLLELGVIE